MDKNPFFEKYSTKSNSELHSIVSSKSAYRLEARIAAIHVLKSRNEKSDFEESTIREFTLQEKDIQKGIIAEKKQLEKTISELKLIPIGTVHIWILPTWQELKVKRLSEKRFRVRIEDSRTWLFAPAMICEIENDLKLKTYPFFYFPPILIALAFSLVIYLLHVFTIVQMENLIFATLFPIVFAVSMQALLATSLYFILKKSMKQELGN